MKTIKIITPANIEVEYRLAGAGSRLAAFTVDFIIQILGCLVIGALILFVTGGLRIPALSEIGSYAYAFLILLAGVVYAGYFIVCELALNGQSAGKKIFGLRVIRDNGLPVGFTQSLVRTVFKIALDMLYVGLFSILFSKKHKRLGDMAAGTVVVSEHYGSAAGNSLSGITIPSVNEERAKDLTAAERYEHIRLSDAEKSAITSFLQRRTDLPDGGEAVYRRLTAYLAEKWNVDAGMFTMPIIERLAEL